MDGWIEYSKFSEMVLVNVKNESCWRLRAMKPEWESLPLMFQLRNPFTWRKLWLVIKTTPWSANEFTCTPSGEVDSLLFQIDNNINNKHIGDNDNTFISSNCFGCSNRNLAQTSLRRKVDLLAQQVQSQLGPGFYFFSSQMALPTG